MKAETRQESPLILDMPFDEALERFAAADARIAEASAAPAKKAAPFVKWVGGKRSIVDELVARLPLEFGAYYEPFVGGAALFFEAADRIDTAVLSDTNFDLVIAFNVVKKNPAALMERLEEHERRHSKVYYYRVRRRHELQDPVEIAARFIYLNKTCYNGLYRVNRKGQFNVPMGRYVAPTIFQPDNLWACNAALSVARIECRQFDTIAPKSGDFVYFDPPYHPTSDTASFTGYTSLDFGEGDQERLRDFARRLARSGVQVMLSNSDTPFIRSLYKDSTFTVETVQAPRYVNSKPSKRMPVNELVITTY